jgi:hypothetical protein
VIQKKKTTAFTSSFKLLCLPLAAGMDRHYLSALNHQQIARQQPFLIDKSPNDASIVNDRLRIMKTFLRQDICGLRPLGLEGSIIDSQKVNEKIPPEVQDACLNWLFYFTRAQNDISDYEEIFCFLNEFFLYWIEALSLLRQLPKGIKIIKILQTLLQVSLCYNIKHKVINPVIESQ